MSNDLGTASRVEWMDGVRGFLLLLMLTEHAVWWSLNAGSAVVPAWVAPVLIASEPARMPVFFLLAGFFASRSLQGSRRAFVLARMRGILWPMALWGMVLGVVLVGPSGAVAFALDPWSSTMWFFAALSLVSVVAILTRRVPVWIVAIAALLFAAVLAVTNGRDGVIPLFGAAIEARQLVQACMFFLGVALARSSGLQSRITGRWVPSVIAGTAVFIVLAIAMVVGVPLPGLALGPLYVPLMVLSALLTFAVGPKLFAGRAFLALLGRRAIVSYLVHPVVQFGVLKVLVFIGITHPVPLMLAAMGASVAAVLVGISLSARFPIVAALFTFPRRIPWSRRASLQHAPLG